MAHTIRVKRKKHEDPVDSLYVQAEPQQKRRYTDFYYRRLQGENDRNSERYKVLNSSVEFHNVSIAERRRTTNWEPADSWNPSEGKPQPVLMTSNTRLSIPDHSSVAADEQHLPSKLPSPLDIIREYDQSTTPAQKPGTDHTQELSFNQLRRFHLRRATEMPSSVLTGGIRKIRETDQVMESFFAEEITPNARCPPKPIEQELLPEKGTNNQSGVIPTHERWTIPNSETHEQPAGTTNKEANPPLVSELEELPMPYRLLLAEVDGQAENFNQNQRQRPQLRHKPKPPNQRKGFDNSLSLNDKPNPVVDQIMKDAECDEEYIYDTYIYQPRARMVDLESMQGRIGLLIVDNEVRSRLEVFEEGNSSEDECHLGEEDENAEDWHGNDYPEDPSSSEENEDAGDDDDDDEDGEADADEFRYCAPRKGWNDQRDLDDPFCLDGDVDEDTNMANGSQTTGAWKKPLGY